MQSEDTRSRIADLEKEASLAETQLARRSSIFRAQSQPINVSTISAQLPSNSVLIEYALYYPFDVSDPDNWTDIEPRYAAYMLFPDGNVRLVDLGEASSINSTVSSLKKNLSDRDSRIETIEQQARALDEIIFEPLRAELDGIEQIFISPDSNLNAIPFEVLRSSQNRYLVEDYDISYLNSGRELAQMNVVPPSNHPPVIIAAPDYGQTIPLENQEDESLRTRRSVDLKSLTVSNLIWAVDEGEALKALMPEAILQTGQDATEGFLRQMSTPSILHIATHGLFLPGAPRREVINTESNSTYVIPTEDPLLRSMLALSGFNSRGSTDSIDDGVFTALEASTLDLYGTQLVVLSACITRQ